MGASLLFLPILRSQMGRWQHAVLTEGHLPRPKQARVVTAARQLRGSMSLPEVLLWQELRNSSEIKFRRQHPLGPYVLDFYNAAARLGVEIDGFAHDTGRRPDRDAKRDAWLAEQSIEVVRIAATDVLRSPHDVATALIALCQR